MQEIETTHTIVIGDSRSMQEIEDESIHLVVTSPPYPMIEMWDGLFRNLDEEIDRLWRRMEASDGDEYVRQIYDLMHRNLEMVWREVYRVLIPGGIACINIGDATRTIKGRFRIFPNHARTIEIFEKIGFVTLPYILWKKPTTKPRYRGKGAFLGSGMLPPNAYITLDCEYILIFRKGEPRKFKPHDPLRYASKYTKNERNKWFTQIWDVAGIRQDAPLIERRVAAFPEEIPRRLIRMFSIIGDTVLDPFLGSGTTMKAAIDLARNSIGYEIDGSLLPLIKEKIRFGSDRIDRRFKIRIVKSWNI